MKSHMDRGRLRLEPDGYCSHKVLNQRAMHQYPLVDNQSKRPPLQSIDIHVGKIRSIGRTADFLRWTDVAPLSLCLQNYIVMSM